MKKMKKDNGINTNKRKMISSEEDEQLSKTGKLEKEPEMGPRGQYGKYFDNSDKISTLILVKIEGY